MTSCSRRIALWLCTACLCFAIPTPGQATGWNGFRDIEGSAGASPSITSMPDGDLAVFSADREGVVWWRQQDAGRWGDWQRIGGRLKGGPAAVATSTRRIDLVGRGLNDHLWHNYWNGSRWRGWVDVGGVLSGPPAITTSGRSKLEIFAPGQDGSVYWLRWTGSSWTEWERVGGSIQGRPAAFAFHERRIDLFARGRNDHLWHNYWNGSRWRGWIDVGGVLTGPPAVASTADGRLEAFAPGQDRSVYWLRWTGSDWSGWERVGGTIQSGPAAVATGVETVHVVVRGQNDHVWLATYSARGGGLSRPAPPESLRPFGIDTLRLAEAEPVLVILSEFTDAPFAAPLGRAFYDDWFFGRGTTPAMRAKTFSGYVDENSYGRTVIQRAGLVSVRFPSTRACAFGTEECPGSDQDGFKYRSKAVELAASQAGFDFAPFDRDRDGRVTPDELAIVAIAASAGRTTGGQKGSKDPACVSVGSGSRRVDVCGDLASFNQNASLMTMIHETSHIWGAYDLYGPGAGLNRRMTTMAATVGEIGGDRGIWHFDPWHKMAFGWLEPRFYRTTDPGNCVSLRAAQDAGRDEIGPPVALYDPARGAAEYFVLEFRKRDAGGRTVSADAEMADATGGLAIWRIRPNGAGTLAGGIDERVDGEVRNFGRANYLGAPDQQRGRGRLWRASDGEIPLKWSDGSPVGVTLRVGPLSPTGGSIQVAWFRDTAPVGPFDDSVTEACFRTVLP